MTSGLDLREDDLLDGRPNTKQYFSDQVVSSQQVDSATPNEAPGDNPADALGTDSKAIQSSAALETTSQQEAVSAYIEQNDDHELKRGQTQTEKMVMPDAEQKELLAKVINRQASAGGRRTNNRSPSAGKYSIAKRRNNKSTGGSGV